MKKVLLSLLLILVLLTSCDLTMMNAETSKPKIYYVGIGLDYKTWNRNKDATTGNSHLKNTKNDLKAITAQLEHLAKAYGYDYRFVTYDDFSSKKINSKNPEDFNYNFYFNVKTNEGPAIDKDGSEITDKEFFYCNIANGQKNTDGSDKHVRLDSFAKTFTDRIYNYLTDYGKDVPGKNDIVIFYYTGHGIENGLGPAVYYQTGNKSEKEICTCALYTPGKPTGKTAINVKDNYIMPLPYLYLEDMFFSRFEATVITLFDCCYSGYAVSNSDLGSIHNFGSSSLNVPTDQLEVPSINSIFNNTFNATFGDSAESKNIYPLTAAHPTQISFDQDCDIRDMRQKNYGAFTYQVLSYLDYNFDGTNTELPVGDVGNPTKPVYSINQMYNYVYEHLGHTTKTYATPNVTRSRFDHAIFFK